MKKTNKGFTLIELLVVIAIIGILSSIVLVSLNSARKKGTDSRIVSDVQQTRIALETGYNGSIYTDLLIEGSTVQPNVANGVGGYKDTNASPNQAVVKALNDDANNNGGHINYQVSTDNNGNVNGYAIYGQLVSDPSHFFCIDSTGQTNQAADHSDTMSCAN